MRLHEKYLLLQVIDQQWKDHLLNVDHLKEGIGLRGYGQRDPLIEYKKESFEIFQEMMERIQDRVVKYLWKTRWSWSAKASGRRKCSACSAPCRRRNRKPQPMVFSGAGGTSGPAHGQAQGTEDRPQRSLLVRQREKVQEVPRHGGVAA